MIHKKTETNTGREQTSGEKNQVLEEPKKKRRPKKKHKQGRGNAAME